MRRTATCSCTKLSVVCEGEPTRISVCHCLECQRRTGSVFGSQAWFPRERVTRDETGASRYVRVAESGNRITFHFCPACGSTVYWELDSARDSIAVAMGAFADPDFPPPTFSVWERRRHSWAEVPGEVQHSK